MTEKKKRERPRKDQGPKIRYIDPVTPEVAVALHNAEHPDQFVQTFTVPATLEKMVEVLGDVDLAKAAIAKLKKTSSPEPSYPSNWNELGKIGKLQWLTANKK